MLSQIIYQTRTKAHTSPSPTMEQEKTRHLTRDRQVNQLHVTFLQKVKRIHHNSMHSGRISFLNHTSYSIIIEKSDPLNGLSSEILINMAQFMRIILELYLNVILRSRPFIPMLKSVTGCSCYDKPSYNGHEMLGFYVQGSILVQ